MATWSGAELEEFIPGTPAGAAVVDNRWIVVVSSNDSGGGTYGGSSNYAVLDALNGTSRSFQSSDLHSNATVRPGRVVAAPDDTVWVVGTHSGISSSIEIAQIEPVSGATAKLASIPKNYSMLVAGPSWVAAGVGSGALTLRDLTGAPEWTVSFGGMQTIGAVGGYLVAGSSGDHNVIDLSDGSTITTIPRHGGSGIGRPRGSRLWWRTTDGAAWVDPAAGTSGTVIASPAGIPAPGDTTVGPDGYLYSLDNEDEMTVFDPDSGRWATRELPTSRDRRYLVVSAAGKLWIPTGEPVGT